MRMLPIVLVLVTGRRRQEPMASPPAPPPWAPGVALAPVDAAPAIVPDAAPAVVGWRVALAEAEHVVDVMHEGFEFPDGFKRLDAMHVRFDTALGLEIAKLPDAAPDLPEAACKLEQRSADRGNLEAQLLRAVAVARRRAAGNVDQLYGSLRTSYLSLQPAYEWRGGKLVADIGDAILGGAASYSCATPDVGHLRAMLAELYSYEERHPIDPFTKQPYPGTPTSKHLVPDRAAKEPDELYREIVAAAPGDAAIASVIELAAIECNERSRVPVCADRAQVVDRALAIRARSLPASDPSLGDTRVERARKLIASKHPKQAEAELRRVLAETQRGAAARVQAAVDLSALVHDARALEPALIEDLAHPSTSDAWLWSELGMAAAELANADQRPADAVRILIAARQGVVPVPGCTRDACDARGFELPLIERQAVLDPAAAPALAAEAATIKGQLEAMHARQLAGARALLGL
jgi:hypothetical protein